eukprot:s939_g14.t1
MPWLSLLILPVASQVVHQWTSQRGSQFNDEARALQVDAKGSAWVAGYTYDRLDGQTNAGRSDVFLMKFNVQGVHQWTRLFGAEESDYAQALQVDAAGHAWVAGSTRNSLDSRLDGHTNAGGSDIVLMKFNAQGVHQWARQRGGEGWDEAFALQVDANGNAWVAGSTRSSLDGHTNAGWVDMFLMKFDAQGVHQWTRQRGDRYDDYANSLQVDAKGNAWVAGYTSSFHLDGQHRQRGTKLDVFLMKFDAQGVHQWTRVRGGEEIDRPIALQVNAEGDAWLAGYTESSVLDGHSNAGIDDMFLMKFNAHGVHQWTRVHGGVGRDKAFALQVDENSHAWVAGHADGSLDGHSNAGSYDVFLMKFDAQGVHQWTHMHGGEGDDRAMALQVDTTGQDAWVAGTTSSSLDGQRHAGGIDIFLMKFRVECSQVTCPAGYVRSPSQKSGGNSTASTTSSTSAEQVLAAFPVSHLEVEQQSLTTTAAIDLDILKKPWISNVQSIEPFLDPASASSEEDSTGLPSEDDSTGLLVAAVVLPLLTACLCAVLGICCYRAKLRQLRGAEAEPQVPNPLAILPPFARMTAEWPRGKVQKLSVRETAFELRGREFQNVVWWRTGHPHPAWQHFRWVCTPKCQVENQHDMELTDSEGDGYRCMSCSRFRAAGKHWYCPQHQVHICPACAELPPEMPTLGLAAKYLVDVFPPLARRVTSDENPDFYKICPNLAHGSAGMGYNRTCPRDGRPNCSIVDALEDAHSGKVTHFVSWCWAYSLNNVVSAIERWLQKSNEDPQNVFLWMCFFCNNQYRIKEEATQTGSDELKEIFESHLVEAGRMLVLLDTIVQPTYVTRAWCIFESYVCIAQEIPMNIILPNTAETFFREAMEAGRRLANPSKHHQTPPNVRSKRCQSMPRFQM